jgi:ABC-2 type transport system permease protein
MEAEMFRLLVQELKFRRNAIIGWGLGLCFFPIVYLSIYPQVAEEMAGFADLEIYQAMGISLGTLEDWIGSILILFVPLILSVFAVINGTGTLAGEEEDGRLEMVVTLPLPRWQIVASKALALSISTFLILLIVSLVSGIVFLAIESQLDTNLAAMDLMLAMLATWPLAFAVAMISMFLAAFCSRRRIAAISAAVILIIGYFGTNLAGTTSAIEPFGPFFLFTYLDYTSSAVTQGQQSSDMLILMALGAVAFALAVYFFQIRKLTVGAWPWQRGKVEA